MALEVAEAQESRKDFIMNVRKRLKEPGNTSHLHSDGSDLIGSNKAEAEDDTDPSSEAEDCSCWVAAADESVDGVSGVVLVASVECVTEKNNWS